MTNDTGNPRCVHSECSSDHCCYQRYRIVRFYFGGGRRVIKRGLILADAQAHCRNPETSSRTCRTAKARKITERNGQWFDGYEEDN